MERSAAYRAVVPRSIGRRSRHNPGRSVPAMSAATSDTTSSYFVALKEIGAGGSTTSGRFTDGCSKNSVKRLPALRSRETADSVSANFLYSSRRHRDEEHAYII